MFSQIWVTSGRDSSLVMGLATVWAFPSLNTLVHPQQCMGLGRERRRSAGNARVGTFWLAFFSHGISVNTGGSERCWDGRGKEEGEGERETQS